MSKPVRRRVKWDDESHKRSMDKKKKLPENTIYAEWGPLDVRRDMLMLGTMLWIPLEMLATKDSRETGLEISVEIHNYVMRSMQVMLKNIPADERKLLTKVLYQDAETCLKATNAPHSIAAILAVAHLIVKLTDEGLIPDPTSNVVLAALCIMTEAEEDKLDGPWKYIEAEVTANSEKIWSRAQMAGYLGTMIPKQPTQH